MVVVVVVVKGQAVFSTSSPFLPVLSRGRLLQAAGQIDDRDVRGRHAERHARQLALQLGDHLADSLPPNQPTNQKRKKKGKKERLKGRKYPMVSCLIITIVLTFRSSLLCTS